jgi:hypothetical protein
MEGTAIFYGYVTAFDPQSAGISITYPTVEFASYLSVIDSEFGSDFHTCDITNPQPDDDWSPTHCAVTSPDHSEFELYIWGLGPGESYYLPVSGYIEADLRGAPESATLPVFASGLFLLSLHRRKGKWRLFAAASASIK